MFAIKSRHLCECADDIRHHRAERHRRHSHNSVTIRYNRILDGQDDNEDEGEGVTIVSQKLKFGPKELWIYFRKSYSSEKLTHNSANPTSISP